MISGESKKLTIAIWALTITIIVSTLIESSILLVISDTFDEVEKIEKSLDLFPVYLLNMKNIT